MPRSRILLRGKAEFTLEYKVTRREYSRGDYSQLKRIDQTPSLVNASMTRLIAPDTLIPAPALRNIGSMRPARLSLSLVASLQRGSWTQSVRRNQSRHRRVHE